VLEVRGRALAERRLVARRLRLQQRGGFERDARDVGAAQAHVVELTLVVALEFAANAHLGFPAAQLQGNSLQKPKHDHSSFTVVDPRLPERWESYGSPMLRRKMDFRRAAHEISHCIVSN